MVIHDDIEKPVELSAKIVNFDEEDSVILNGKRKENSTKNVFSMDIQNENTQKSQNVIERKLKKRKIKSQEESTEEEIHPSFISHEDLQELKIVYKKCKAVMKKIESKYGHLLDLDTEEPSNKNRKNTENNSENECQCTFNKKIIFDEDGKEVSIDASLTNHICPQKLLTLQPKPLPVVNATENKSIQIEYSSNDIVLSDDLQELATILQNSELETTYRNQIIDKVRSIKLENSNEIKFNKHSLVEKLKIDPDTILDFRGANLSALSGYF